MYKVMNEHWLSSPNSSDDINEQQMYNQKKCK